MSLFYFGTGHYLCRGGGGGKKVGEAKLSYKVVWGGGQQFDRKVYFKRGPLAKIGSAKLYNFKLILLLFVYLKHHYFVQLSHLHLTEILFEL